MKKVEKLASEHASKVYDQTPGFPSEKEWVSLCAHKAYVAGFRAAREMAVEAARAHAANCPVGSSDPHAKDVRDTAQAIAKQIAQLGEDSD